MKSARLAVICILILVSVQQCNALRSRATQIRVTRVRRLEEGEIQ